ncbi:MAG: DUF3105 domain-containing protein [bacterium]|nr:DUF3105 domain-containing protein [bacterium]
MKQVLLVLVVVIVVLGVGVILFLTSNESAKDLPAVGEEFSILGANHINVGAEHEEYNSNPPTSGSHYAQAAAWGFYDEELPDEQLIHSLEHGGIWISYKDVDDQTKEYLNFIARKNSGSVIVTPRPENDTKISLASWGRLENLDEFDENKINNFIRSNKNKSPEPIAN